MDIESFGMNLFQVNKNWQMAVLVALLIISCCGPAEKTENKQQKPDSAVTRIQKDSVVTPSAEKPQTVEERI